MLENKLIEENEYNDALSKELVFYGQKDTVNLSTLMYYQDAVFDELKNLKGIPETYLTTGGLKIYTNLDIKAQTDLENSIKKNITDKKEYEERIIKRQNEIKQHMVKNQ